MLDIVIRNGRIVDGSGLPAFQGDLGIRDGASRAWAAARGRARAEIDARGRVVAPGFIDPHTHFDAQLLWDGQARPALEHGVTTVVHGNCSLSLAPLKAEHRPKLVGMFQQIEEMPDAAFDGAFEWTWEELRRLRRRAARPDRRERRSARGAQLIRMWVMGDDAQKRAATADEIRAMQDCCATASRRAPWASRRAIVDVDENLLSGAEPLRVPRGDRRAGGSARRVRAHAPGGAGVLQHRHQRRAHRPAGRAVAEATASRRPSRRCSTRRANPKTRPASLAASRSSSRAARGSGRRCRPGRSTSASLEQPAYTSRDPIWYMMRLPRDQRLAALRTTPLSRRSSTPRSRRRHALRRLAVRDSAHPPWSAGRWATLH